MTQELSLKQYLAEGFDSWKSEQAESMPVLVLQVLDALELLQQVVLEGSRQWEETLLKLKVVQPAVNRANAYNIQHLLRTRTCSDLSSLTYKDIPQEACYFPSIVYHI